MKRIGLVVVAALCLAFGLRALLLVDATALWGDELYSVGKSFQPSFSRLMAMLREDTHPPAYYTLLWLWGHLVGQNPISLRLLSWLAYVAGGLVMVCQAMVLGEKRPQVAVIAALLVFCSPYPIRFAIEGKSYALLVLLLSLAWWWRRSAHPMAYGITAALAGLTHFYGLFLVLVPAVVPVVAVQIGGLDLNRLGRCCSLLVLGLLLASWWGPGFAELDPVAGGAREQDQFRLISQRTSGLAERYSPRSRLLNLSDRMEEVMGRIPKDPVPRGNRHALERRLAMPPLPRELWLASSGPLPKLTRKMQPMQEQVEREGYTCRDRSGDLSYARLLQCQSAARVLR